MHQSRNNAIVFALSAAIIYGLFAWLLAPDLTPDVPPSVTFHKYAAASLTLALAAGLVYFVFIRDKLSDDLARVSGGSYFEKDGLCFFPTTRVRRHGDKLVTDLCLYYQNRYGGVCETVIHITPPSETIYSHKGATDIHFAFIAKPGGFGIIHQPVAVAREFQGRAITLKVGAAVRWPGLRGEKLRSKEGRPCGDFNIDWNLAHRLSRHELCGEIELIAPASTTIGLPTDVVTDLKGGMFKQEVISFFQSDSERAAHSGRVA
ncbi:MAG: hypothetical protein AAF108_06765 [Planctomycetota bacterium]